VSITESERNRLAQTLDDLPFDGTAEENRLKVVAVTGHLEPDEADAVMKLAAAMNHAYLARLQAAHEKEELREAVLKGHPPGTTYDEIIAGMTNAEKVIFIKKVLRPVRTRKA
jgi:hypothetical protein